MTERRELTASLDRHDVERRTLLVRITVALSSITLGTIACAWRCVVRIAGSAIDRWWIATAILAAVALSRAFADARSLRDVLRRIRALRAALRRSAEPER